MRGWKRLGVGLLLVACAASGWAAQRTEAVDAYRAMNVTQKIVTSNGVQFSLELAAPEWGVAGKAGEQVQVAELLAGAMMEEPGQPVVPVAGRFFRIPAQSGIVLEVLNAEYETLTDVDYAVYYGSDDPEGRSKNRRAEIYLDF